MSGPFEAAGALKGPTKYSALHMGGRQFTGLVTQKSPYRDGAVPYLVAKFSGGTRFDTIRDGLNREITQRLTDGRAPGSRAYNTNTFPAIASFYPWKYIQNAAEIVRVIVDGSDGTIYDATAGQKTALFAKSAGAGPARFLGVNTELFFGDGVDTKKILRSAKRWKAATSFNIGDFILDSNGNIQSVQANPVTYGVTSTEVVLDPYSYAYVVITLAGPAPLIPPNQTASFTGLTGTGAFLNGLTLTWQGTLAGLNLAANQIAFATSHATYAPSASAGSMVALTATPGVTGGVQPAWGATFGAVTNDGGLNGGVNWTCFQSPVENWGITPVPFASPSYLGSIAFDTAQPKTRFWGAPSPYPFVFVPKTIKSYSILDPSGNVQVATFTYLGAPPARTGGTVYPAWSSQIGTYTPDSIFTWLNYGQIASAWYAMTNYGGFDGTNTTANPCVIIDSNGNLQGVDSIAVGGQSGAGVPAWATAEGATTADGTVTWVCLGPGSVLWSGVYQYAWSPVGIDGTVGTASPVTLIPNGGLGVNSGFKLQLSFDLAGTAAVTDKQVSRIALWRTAQGKSTLILLDYIPNPWLLGNTVANYADVSNDLDLNAFISAPVAKAADPPQASMTAPVYYLQRVWGIVDNTVVYSGGPDTVTGNGNTAFPPLNEIPFLAQPIRLIPVLVQNGGLIVMTTDGIKIILGTGTASNPFYVGDYLELVSILNYDAVSVFYNQIFCMESNGKVSSLAIEYPFNPQSGYTEIGFPIGDQFVKTTTGGQNSQLFNPATATLSWNAHSSADTGMYVSSGTGFWFRMSLINPPESGILWSPLRQLQGGASAVQSVETAPGIRNLLIGPPAGTPGPILMRDTTGTVWTDLDAGVATKYPGWDAKGVTQLCTTGQFASVKHISTKSVNTGGPRPTIGVLFNEIEPSPQRPYIDMTVQGKGNDPPRNRESLSVYSDRYRLAQQGQETTGDCILIKFDYGTEAYADELLDWAIYGAVHEEDEEQAAKV